MADAENVPPDPENDESREAWAYRRFATRIQGEGWAARIRGIAGPVRVLNLSRIGIALETEEPLAAYQRFPLELTGPEGKTETQFYVLRCPEVGNDGDGRIYRPAGLFVSTIPREDLPEAIPESPPLKD